ncbi:MAG: response regulator transcription factor [Dehalogenimonas sp.]
MKILIIEDDPGIVELVSLTFELGWPDVKLIVAGTGEKGMNILESDRPDAVILDIGLPDTNGFEIIKAIRLFSDVPILMLTVRIDERDVVKALTLGADDYLTKPFRQMELLARIKAITRRTQHGDQDLKVSNGPWHFGKTLTELYRGQQIFHLTPIQGLIMQSLIKQAGQFVSAETLAGKIWGEHHAATADDLRVHIHHLRKKFDENRSGSSFISNKPGLGYMLVSE